MGKTTKYSYNNFWARKNSDLKATRKQRNEYFHKVPPPAKPKSLSTLAASKIPLAQVDEYLYGHLKKPGQKPIKHLRSQLAKVKFDKEISKYLVKKAMMQKRGQNFGYSRSDYARKHEAKTRNKIDEAERMSHVHAYHMSKGPNHYLKRFEKYYKSKHNLA